MADFITSKVVINKDKLQEVIHQSPQKAINLVDALAFDGEAYVKRSFGTSPSKAGDPPGVVTGALRASIHVEELGTYTRAITTGVDYAFFLEFGTIHMAARPFMQPMAIYLQGRIEPFWARFIE